MKQSKISIRSETNKFTDFVTDILDCIVVSDCNDYWVLLEEGLDLDIDFFGHVL